jgi:AcrR family transcriptional regulator
MSDRNSAGPRANQRYRARKDLLAAAAELTKGGRTPTMDEVAQLARVSRATAYRYFPSVEQLLIEAPLDGEAPDPDQFFAADSSADAVDRADRAEAALHNMCYRNAARLRTMLAASLGRQVDAPASKGGDPASTGDTSFDVPIRQNRRMPLIEAALAPISARLDPAEFQRLCSALALVFGTESMIVFTDVLGMEAAAARQVKSWAIGALIQAALAESNKPAAAPLPGQ